MSLQEDNASSNVEYNEANLNYQLLKKSGALQAQATCNQFANCGSGTALSNKTNNKNVCPSNNIQICTAIGNVNMGNVTSTGRDSKIGNLAQTLNCQQNTSSSNTSSTTNTNSTNSNTTNTTNTGSGTPSQQNAFTGFIKNLYKKLKDYYPENKGIVITITAVTVSLLVLLILL
jgi:hypothetical protein